jgi:hypothetical protein
MRHSEEEKPVFSKKIEKTVHASKVERAIQKPLLYLYNLRRFIPPIRRFPAPKDITPFIGILILQYTFRQDHWLKEMKVLWSSERRDALALELPTDDFGSTLLLLVCLHLSTTVTGCAVVPGGFEARGLAAGLVIVVLGIQIGVFGYWWYWTELFQRAVVAMVLLVLLKILTVAGIVIAFLYSIFYEKETDSEKQD